MNTHLKGRIFSSEGTSYLVLQGDDEAPGWVRVRSIGPRRKVSRMRISDVEKLLPMIISKAK